MEYVYKACKWLSILQKSVGNNNKFFLDFWQNKTNLFINPSKQIKLKHVIKEAPGDANEV